MAYLDKDAYERREAYAHRRFRENAEIAEEQLTEEQIELLDKLTSFRHELHTSHEELFRSQGTHNLEEQIVDIFITDETLNERINEAFGKRAFQYVRDYIEKAVDIYDDYEYEEANEEEKDEVYLRLYSELYHSTSRSLERINDEIEAFLREIDKKCGTTFCPTGRTRIY